MKKSSEGDIKAMAELLLSRATMLQYHCGKCGSPLFKKDDRILCPKCGEVESKEEPAKEERKDVTFLVGRKVCVKTAGDVYRGVCKSVDPGTISFTLEKAERLNLYGRTGEDKWSPLSELLFIQGSKIEAAWLEEMKEDRG